LCQRQHWYAAVLEDTVSRIGIGATQVSGSHTRNAGSPSGFRSPSSALLLHQHEVIIARCIDHLSDDWTLQYHLITTTVDLPNDFRHLRLSLPRQSHRRHASVKCQCWRASFKKKRDKGGEEKRHPHEFPTLLQEAKKQTITHMRPQTRPPYWNKTNADALRNNCR